MLRQRQRSRRRRGFTLMEVLLVVAILIILASMAVVAIGPIRRGALVKQAKLDITAISNSIDVYLIDVGDYPPALEALVYPPEDQISQSKWNGPYLKKGLPPDPWGQSYQYQVEGDHIIVWSMGPDRVNGTDDDITLTGV